MVRSLASLGMKVIIKTKSQWPNVGKDRPLSQNEMFVRDKFSSVSKLASYAGMMIK